MLTKRYWETWTDVRWRDPYPWSFVPSMLSILMSTITSFRYMFQKVWKEGILVVEIYERGLSSRILHGGQRGSSLRFSSDTHFYVHIMITSDRTKLKRIGQLYEPSLALINSRLKRDGSLLGVLMTLARYYKNVFLLQGNHVTGFIYAHK